MADLSNKKRKREAEGAAKPKKKVVIDAPPSTVTVASLLKPKTLPPVIVTSAGISIPTDINFHSFSRKDEPRKKSKHAADKELLLHSTAHRSVDFTAKEDIPQGSKPLLNHFVGVFDPKTGQLQVVEAKKMVGRGSVRAKQASAEAMGQRNVRQNMLDLKADLGETFGTKKAKKALHERVLNAITPLRRPGDDTPIKIDEASRAMLTSVGQITSTMASREQLQAVVDEARPVPKANLEAEDIQDVYDPQVIIGKDILNLVPIREWQEKVKHNESIQSVSRYIVSRVAQVASSEEELTRLRVLRYMLFVITFYLNSKPGRQKGTRSVLPREKLREVLDPAPEAVIENIRRKFSDAGQMRKFHIDLLVTHCCAFACIVDNFEVDTQDLKQDLRLDQSAMNQYFHEIGARVKPVTNKAEGRSTTIARLALPLQFPKQRHINPKRR